MAFPRFVAAGAINTGATYLLYVALLWVIPYGWAYSVSFLAGILLGYLLNSRWVFREAPSLKTAAGYPLIYATNYVLGICLLWLLVDKLGAPAFLAPLVVIPVSVPIMYLLTRALFKKNHDARLD
ncbi:GtrA-like protein [Bordetella ansorpii]|uniref:GtrA-like protein n=1 Tax=Bordetella ansorpii TaxID=288768 RepID=A0A157S9N4_9BORD|nr:GtrA family protein [Bordetella ansorpii]SAI67137.1 GtrA-like protein [Bordetella ansorpii]